MSQSVGRSISSHTIFMGSDFSKIYEHKNENAFHISPQLSQTTVLDYIKSNKGINSIPSLFKFCPVDLLILNPQIVNFTGGEYKLDSQVHTITLGASSTGEILPIITNKEDNYMIPPTYGKKSSIKMSTNSFNCQYVPQDGGTLLSNEVDIILTAPITGCKFYMLKSGDQLLSFHTNQGEGCFSSWEKFKGVAFNMLNLCSKAEIDLIHKNIDILYKDLELKKCSELNVSNKEKELKYFYTKIKQTYSDERLDDDIINDLYKALIPDRISNYSFEEKLAFILSDPENLKQLCGYFTEYEPRYGMFEGKDHVHMELVPFFHRDRGTWNLTEIMTVRFDGDMYASRQDVNKPQVLNIISPGKEINMNPPDFWEMLSQMADNISRKTTSAETLLSMPNMTVIKA